MHSRVENRMNAVYELLNTEKTYIRGLDVIINIFYNPLKMALSTDSPILLKKDLNILFSDLFSISSLSKEYISELIERLENSNHSWDPHTGCVGDICAKYFPFMKMYTMYLSHFTYSLERYESCIKENDRFASFIEEGEKSRVCNGLSFKSYLLLPVQRIPRYKLLLKNILSNTDEDHPDFIQTKRAFEVIDKVAKAINESIREQQMIHQILDIQKNMKINEFLLAPGRKLIREGLIHARFKSTMEKRHIYLFSDMLMYLRSSGLFFCEQECKALYLENLDVLQDDSGKMSIELMYKGKSPITLQLDSSDEKNEWSSEISTAIITRKSELSKSSGSIDLRRSAVSETKLSHEGCCLEPTNDNSTCQLCYKTYGILHRRKRHCRSCNKNICAQCIQKLSIGELCSKCIMTAPIGKLSSMAYAKAKIKHDVSN